MRTATLSQCTDGEVWIVVVGRCPDGSGYPWSYKAFETEAEAQAFADEMSAEEERRLEHARQVYQAFRDALGEEGKFMSEEEVGFEVDDFLASRGMTLADVELDDAGRWKH